MSISVESTSQYSGALYQQNFIFKSVLLRMIKQQIFFLCLNLANALQIERNVLITSESTHLKHALNLYCLIDKYRSFFLLKLGLIAYNPILMGFLIDILSFSNVCNELYKKSAFYLVFRFVIVFVGFLILYLLAFLIGAFSFKWYTYNCELLTMLDHLDYFHDWYIISSLHCFSLLLYSSMIIMGKKKLFTLVGIKVINGTLSKFT